MIIIFLLPGFTGYSSPALETITRRLKMGLQQLASEMQFGGTQTISDKIWLSW